MSKPPTQHVTPEQRELRALILPLLSDLHRVALRLTHSATDAEELVAEVVLRACENFGSLRDLTKAKQWMLRILANTFVSSYRANKRRQQIPYEELENDDQPFSLFAEVARLSVGNPEREVIAKLMDEDIQSAIASLPEEYRIVVVLCDVEGYSYNEIAALLEIPIGTVRSRLSRGRGMLQKRLYHYARDQGWLSAVPNSFTGNKHHEPCECERNILP
jgi:RNA polymerase sigma-70 factor (ECF subfamily)